VATAKPARLRFTAPMQVGANLEAGPRTLCAALSRADESPTVSRAAAVVCVSAKRTVRSTVVLRVKMSRAFAPQGLAP
jgi:hypothetical protein